MATGLFIFSVLLQALDTACGLNFLVVPYGMSSHVIMSGRMASGLIKVGHQATVLLPTNAKVPSWFTEDGIGVFWFKGEGEVPAQSRNEVSEILLKAKFSTSMMEKMRLLLSTEDIILPDVIQECHNLLGDEPLRKKILEEKFDYVIMDSIGLTCLVNYPVSLGIDYFMFSISGLGWGFRVPDLPSFVPGLSTSTSTDEMNFMERLANTAEYLATMFFWNTTNHIDMSEYPPWRAIPDVKEIMANALFWFVLDDISLSYPRPYMPNMVSIGDLMVPPSKPLPDDFQDFLDASPEGVILVSFGSFYSHFPDSILEEFCQAFDKVPQKILWKMSFQPPCLKNHHKVRVVNWMPQNDLLGHPNLKLFITHCGKNSMLEALYHAKPMLGFPIAYDQPANAFLLEKKGYGLQMDLADFTGDTLASNITFIINDQTIKEKIQLGSHLLKDKPQSPEERLGYWVDHISKYGSQHLRTGAFKLNIFQFLMGDIIIFVLVMLVIIIHVVLLLLYCFYRLCRRCCDFKKPKQKAE